MKLTATVVWSVGLELDLPDNSTEKQQQDAIHDAAMKSDLDFKNFVVADCSNENLID
jgi:hypothetical protein